MFDKSDRERWAKGCYDSYCDMKLIDKVPTEICVLDKQGRWHDIAIEDIRSGMDIAIRGNTENMLGKGLVIEDDIIQIAGVEEIRIDGEDFMIRGSDIFCSNNDISQEYADYQYQLALNGNQFYDQAYANFNEAFAEHDEEDFDLERT